MVGRSVTSSFFGLLGATNAVYTALFYYYRISPKPSGTLDPPFAEVLVPDGVRHRRVPVGTRLPGGTPLKVGLPIHLSQSRIGSSEGRRTVVAHFEVDHEFRSLSDLRTSVERLDELLWEDDWMLGDMRTMSDSLVIGEGTKEIKGTHNQGYWKGDYPLDLQPN